MKKFVIVMITVLVLFTFLMLNYLLWDKENLLKQSESDRIEQDWLRGQNRTLQTTVNEQDQTIKQLERDKSELQTRINGLDQKLRQANNQNESYKKEIAGKEQVISHYKLFTADRLCELTQNWFASINSRDYDAVWELMASNYLVFGQYFNRESLEAYLDTIHSITLIEAGRNGIEEIGLKTDEEQPEPPCFSFEILRGYGGNYEVMAVLEAEIVMNEEHTESNLNLGSGANRLQITYRFNPENEEWAILSLVKAGA